jgi:imidazolonepropionase-like amidohydrolase
MAGRRFIVAGSFIDGSGGEVRRNVFLAVQDTVITGIGAAADLPRQAGGPVADFSHCTIVPALIDCSVSLSRSPSVDMGVRSAAAEAGRAAKVAMVARHIRYCQSYGVLGVAAGDELIDLGPQAGGGLMGIRAAGSSAAGDFLRIAYSVNIEDVATPEPRLSPADLDRMLKNRGARKAVIVANGRQRVAEALAAGCEAIEQGYGMGEDNLRQMAAQQVLWIPSLLRAKNGLDAAGSGGAVCCRFSQRYVAPGPPDPGAEVFWRKNLAEQLGQLRLARKLGVTTAVGTGAGSVGILHGESLVEEMKLFIKGGYSLAETIRCASANGAGFFGMTRLGALTVGRPATFLITRGTPQQLPRKLAYLEGIYVDGAPCTTYRKNPVKMVRPERSAPLAKDNRS